VYRKELLLNFIYFCLDLVTGFSLDMALFLGYLKLLFQVVAFLYLCFQVGLCDLELTL
jgi:hypothetical protein